MATALNDDIFSPAGQPESAEELSSKIESSFPSISHEDAAELAEIMQLMKELEREVFLTNQIIGVREEKVPRPEEAIVKEAAEEAVEKIVERPAPEEIVVAKQISEEPDKSLPREEKSLITELEEKEKVTRKFTPLPRPPAPLVKVYSKGELERDKSSIAIEIEQTVLVPTVGLKRFMVTEPGILKAARVDNKISVTGTGLGKTFLHIWDSEGRRTIRVKVIQKGYVAFAESRKRAVEATKMESFKVRYSFDKYRLVSESDNPARDYPYAQWFHRLGVTGETPWGMTNSRLQVEGRQYGRGAEDTKDITAWDFNLRGDDLEISLGDTGVFFSDITIPHTTYQGFRFKNPDKKNINYDLVWGARGNRMWGYKVLGWDTANYFMGARGQIEPADFIHFNATVGRALEDAEDIGEYLYAGGVGLNFLDDTVVVESEFARSKSEETDVHNHAYKIDATVDLEDYDLILKGTYRDIDPDFLLVTGTSAPHIGELGYYFDTAYNPLKYLRLRGQYNVFRNRYSFNATETQRYNYDLRGTADFDIGPDTKFRYASWDRRREGEATPTRGHGETYQISHNLSLPKLLERPISLYFWYEPRRYRNLSDNTADYRERKYTAGVRLSLLKGLYYDFGHTWQDRRMLTNGEQGTVKSLTSGMRYSRQIFDTPFYGSLNFRYRQESDVMDNMPLTSGEDVISGGAEIKYRPSPDFESYLRGDYRHIRGVLDSDQDRGELRVYCGGSYLLDTTLRWGVGGAVQGVVFRDVNGNGEKDPDEKGFPGINVYAGETRSTVSDSEGNFEFRKVKGTEVSIMFDTKMVPEGYKSTTPNPQMVRLERGLVSEAHFGVIAVSEISGRVFNDVNMNETFDDGDEGTKGAFLILDDGKMAQTMSSGHYRMEDIKEGAKTLELDVATLPFGLIPLTKAKRTIEVEEGRYYKEDFPLYALRTLVGNVFIDKNGNNQFDAGEGGIADVQVGIEDNITLTDDMGRFFLKKLKGGSQRVEVDVETIPGNYEIIGDAFQEVILSPEGEIKEDINFPLVEK